ncbi:MAG: ribbon-helix-helix domain-containing protein [Candidatus Bathyarchaeia archaeon]
MSINAINMNDVISLNENDTVETMAKIRLQVTVREDLVKWTDEQVEKLRFASRSHAVEYALTQLKEKEKIDKKA